MQVLCSTILMGITWWQFWTRLVIVAHPVRPAEQIVDVGREHDVLLSCQFPHYGNIITMYLPLTSTDQELGRVCDAIEDAVNYRSVAKAMIAHVREGRPHLVERLAAELADICLAADPRIAEVEVAVEKPGALRYARSVGVVIRRRREGEPA